jgi:hypothetical protein
MRYIVSIAGIVAFANAAPLPAQDPAARQPGVLVEFYDIGEAVPALPEMPAGLKPNTVILATLVDLQTSRGDFGELKDNFLTRVIGFLRVKDAGRYTLRLISDDGSKLWLDGRLVIDHDGLHGPEPKDAEVELSAGEHALRIAHFESSGGEALSLQWKPPGASAFVPLPAQALVHNPADRATTAPGRKRIIAPLRRGRPGDGRPVVGPHPTLGAGRKPLTFDASLADWLSADRVRIIGEPLPPSTAPTVAWLSSDAGPDHHQLLPARSDVAAYLSQLLFGAPTGFESKRVFPDSPGQGCVFRFSGPEAGSGERSAGAPFEMLAVRAMSNGFEIEFTRPLDPRCGWEPDAYYVEQWPFDLAKGQSPTRDGVVYLVKSASVSEDRRKVFLGIGNLKPSHVVYLRLLPPCISDDGALPWSTEAWYTLNAIPTDRTGQVRQRPPQPPQNQLTQQEVIDGWTLLFDGKTTTGWRGFKKPAMPTGPDGKPGWQVIDGSLVRAGPGGDIITTEKFDNFELSLEWRTAAGGNSGIFFHVAEGDSLNAVYETGPEYQVLDNGEHRDGGNTLTSAGSNYALHAPAKDLTSPIGLFNQSRIIANGPHVEHWLNGVKIVEYELWSPEWEKLVADSKFASMPRYGREKTGHIALQDHGDRVWYRNIKIRRLDGDGSRGAAKQ